MSPRRKSDRTNQQRRTRKDLLAAAARLIKSGRRPTIEEVAGDAMVSRATAYRYFPSIEALLVEAPLDIAMPDAEAFFADDRSSDVEARLDRADAALHDQIYANEAALRVMLANALTQPRSSGDAALPVRQNRRLPLIEAALAPARGRLTKEAHRRLCAALCLIIGTESMIVFRDVLPLERERARQVKSWALRALTRAAIQESRKG